MLSLAVLLPAGALVARPAAAEADPPLLSPQAPEAKAVKYTENAATAKAATAGANCGSCALYQGKYGSAQGPCQIFPGKSVKAAGWCSSWAAQM
ncbi:MAG: high-potential iron-sulfur protein [Proteobacteria bacterium]|nr:high-potential iron-sulfur protein [Pseudomonadota bacterium]